MDRYNIAVIGGGIAGLSIAARLSQRANVVVFEAESAPGYHASGRSVALAHFGLGERIVRTLTAMSLPDLHGAQVHPALHVARAGEEAALDALEEVHRHFGCDYLRLTGEQALEYSPALVVGAQGCVGALLDRGALKLDTDAMLQAHIRTLRENGGALKTGSRIDAISRVGDGWSVGCNGQETCCDIIVNAAGAWADEIAETAGVSRIGIEPRRRTVISFAGPAGLDVSRWPFTKTLGEGFYMLPEGRGQLLASAMDESEIAPCDAAAEEIDIATAAYRIEQGTTLRVERIAHSWAGLRSFAPDELPVVGFAADAPGFFWFAGQGGFGFQTSPALAEIGDTVMFGGDWPDALSAVQVTAETFAPARFGA